MTTILDVLTWANSSLSRWGKDHIELIECTGNNLKFKIYTDNNAYFITAIDSPDSSGYLGCIATSRKPRAGEDWHRGSDLADGSLSEETWHKILADIVSYELVKVHKPKNIEQCPQKGIMETVDVLEKYKTKILKEMRTN